MKQKIKVAHIITRLIIGGAQENTLLTVNGLRHLPDYSVTLISGPTYGPEGSLVDRVRGRSALVIIPALRRNINLFYDVAALWALYRRIKRERFNIVHTHSSKAGILGRLAAKLAGTPYIVHTVHGMPFFKHQSSWKNRLYRFMEKSASAWTDKIICVSKTLVEEAVAAGIAPREKLITIYSGIDVAAFRKDSSRRARIREKLGIPGQTPVIGKIARLFPLKGHEYLLDAAVSLKTQIPEVKILLIGDGILKQSLMLRARRLGIADSIIFAGLVPPQQIPEYIQAIDVLAHTSLHEGLPRAVVQGFAGGIPVVCFDVDGARDVVIDSVNGYLVPAKNTELLATRLIELLRDPNKAQRMGSAGERTAGERFNAESMVSAIDAVYREILACGK
ncbi:MAG: glycosyltransferase family 4 protein [Candidatus Omnitrophica bacterium]|nr:glycosyltransferase family 4 protein [Candidatus Omnitrophota bacterium]